MPIFPVPNNDSKWDDFSGVYTKGLLQSNAGIPDSASATAFVCEIDRGRNAVAATPPERPIETGCPLFEPAGLMLGNMGNASGKLNGPQGAFAGQVGADESFKYRTLAPPPVGSNEYAVELAELYWASLLRDVPFAEFVDAPPPPGPMTQRRKLIDMACADLTTWARAGYYFGPLNNGQVTPSLLFRGGIPAGKHKDFSTSSLRTDTGEYFSDEKFGPYLSQLCLCPTGLGAQPINQKIKTFIPGRDYMIDLMSWEDVQNGKKPSGGLDMDPTLRHIRSSRDLAAYTHVDELYQAYLVAYLVLAGWGAPANPGFPYSKDSMTPYKNQKPFGTMGGPEISAFLGVVARAAIEAVWWQKWAVHLRARPEAGGGLVHLWKTNAQHLPQAAHFDTINAYFATIMDASLKASSGRYSPHSAKKDEDRIFLLSQAFPEGSPTHPAYPTGHGAVAGACITALKFFFDGKTQIQKLAAPMVPRADGLALNLYEGDDIADMTVNGELHKLAHNISFGHGVLAGIHWRTDTDESMLLGEQVALNCLDKLVNTYTEKVDVKIIKMDGTPCHIMKMKQAPSA